jgi:hypothetical protein
MKITKRQIRRIIKEERAKLREQAVTNPALQAETIVEKIGGNVWSALGVDDPYAGSAKMSASYPWVNETEVMDWFDATRKSLEELIRNNEGE